MISANLDLVRLILSDWERADFRSVAWAHPDIEYVLIGCPEPGRWSGPDQMSRSVREYISAWDTSAIKAQEFREFDSERVLVLVRLSGRGKVSGLRLEDAHAEGVEVWYLCDGMFTRLVMYWHRDEALADLGLVVE